MSLNTTSRMMAVGLLALSGAGLIGAQDTPEQKAQRSDEAWFALIDASRYGESWKAASPLFQSAITEEKWSKALESVRIPLGKVEGRRLLNATYSKTMPGAPDGEYVVAQYQTNFEHKKDAVETVTSKLDKDGQWRLSGYYIK